jgi:hypothetical protein
VSEQQLDLIAASGGPLGIAETVLPGVAFVVAYTVSGQDTETSAIVAVAVAGLLTLVRLVRRETPRHALAGLVGVVFAAFVATRSGKAENFFLPGLLLNAAYAAGCLISIAVRKPLVGLVVPHAPSRAAFQATWGWVGFFSLRLAVQLPLYLAGAVVALGIARTAMGVPLFAIGIWLTWLLVRDRGYQPEP